MDKHIFVSDVPGVCLDGRHGYTTSSEAISSKLQPDIEEKTGKKLFDTSHCNTKVSQVGENPGPGHEPISV